MNSELVKLRAKQVIVWLGISALVILTVALLFLLHELAETIRPALTDWRIVTPMFVLTAGVGNILMLYMRIGYYRDRMREINNRGEFQKAEQWSYSRWYRLTIYFRFATLAVILLMGIGVEIVLIIRETTDIGSLNAAIPLVWIVAAAIALLIQSLHWVSTKRKLSRTSV